MTTRKHLHYNEVAHVHATPDEVAVNLAWGAVKPELTRIEFCRCGAYGDLSRVEVAR